MDIDQMTNLLCVCVLKGMLEPTKEPVKPVSAAEMIASIAQAPAAGPEKSPCAPDTVQVGLLLHVNPPVQHYSQSICLIRSKTVFRLSCLYVLVIEPLHSYSCWYATVGRQESAWFLLCFLLF